MFEVLAILFVLLGIVGSVLQAAQKGKHTGTGFPPPRKTETSEINLDEDERFSSSQKLIRKGTYKSVQKKPREVVQTWAEVNPVTKANQSQVSIDMEIQHDEISLDRKSVLNGVIFSVILSPPKCKGLNSII